MKSLREWRVSRLLSTRALADLAEVSNKTLIDIELGRRHPHYSTISRLSRALGVEPTEVFEFVVAMEHLGKDAA